jgi:acyl-CoA synthetase (AMP-forming)/AMP-acid ligase II
MISHRNVIANVMQATAYDSVSRKALQQKFGNKSLQDVQLGLLPFNHIYALVLICNAGVYRGDRTIVLPKFEMATYLQSIHHYRIQTLYVVSPYEIYAGSCRPPFCCRTRNMLI